MFKEMFAVLESDNTDVLQINQHNKCNGGDISA